MNEKKKTDLLSIVQMKPWSSRSCSLTTFSGTWEPFLSHLEADRLCWKNLRGKGEKNWLILFCLSYVFIICFFFGTGIMLCTHLCLNLFISYICYICYICYFNSLLMKKNSILMVKKMYSIINKNTCKTWWWWCNGLELFIASRSGSLTTYDGRGTFSYNIDKQIDFIFYFGLTQWRSLCPCISGASQCITCGVCLQSYIEMKIWCEIKTKADICRTSNLTFRFCAEVPYSSGKTHWK